MNKMPLALLVLVTAALVAAVVMLVSEPDSGEFAQAGEAVYPDLEGRINEVAQVEIKHDGTDTIIELGEAGWGVTSKDGYSADFAKVKDTLLSLASLKIIEPKTSQPEKYERLGVDAPGAGKSSSVVRVKDQAGDLLVALIVGQPKAGTEPALYVRKEDGDQAWLVRGRLQLGARPQDWLETSIVDLAVGRLARVTVAHADGGQLVVYKDKPEDKDFKVADLPEGAELEYEGVANGIASAISGLTLQDVFKRSEFEMDEANVTKSVFETFDNLRIEAATLSKDDKHYAYFQAAHNASSGTGAESEDLGQERGGQEPRVEEQGEGTRAPEEVEQEARELNQRLAGWVFEIASVSADNLTKTLEDLVKKDEEGS